MPKTTSKAVTKPVTKPVASSSVNPVLPAKADKAETEPAKTAAVTTAATPEVKTAEAGVQEVKHEVKPVSTEIEKHAPEFDLAELLEAGVHFGHQSRKWHPSMKEWIYAEKEGIHLIDLAKTAQQLQHAYDFAYDLGAKGKTFVMVATKRQARDIVKAAADDAGCLFITARWLGGLLTNWEQVSRSLKRMLDIEEGLATDKFKGYTKFERGQMEKEQNRLERFFAGIKSLKQRPDALFIVDPSREKNAVKEAAMMNVPIIALVDTNTDPRSITVPIPGNDDAAASIEIIVKAVAAGYKAGKAAKK